MIFCSLIIKKNSLMEESPEEIQRREETLRIYHSTKEALKIIDDVARDAVTEHTPQYRIDQNDYR